MNKFEVRFNALGLVILAPPLPHRSVRRDDVLDLVAFLLTSIRESSLCHFNRLLAPNKYLVNRTNEIDVNGSAFVRVNRPPAPGAKIEQKNASDFAFWLRVCADLCLEEVEDYCARIYL